MSLKRSVSPILSCESVVINTPAKEASLLLAAGSGMDHGLPHGFQQQHRMWAPTCPPAAPQITGICVASCSSADPGNLPRKLNAENEPVLVSDVLLLFPGSMSGRSTCRSSRLLYTTLPSAVGPPACTSGMAIMFFGSFHLTACSSSSSEVRAGTQGRG